MPFQDAIDFQEGPGILAKDFRESGVPLIRLAGLSMGAHLLQGCNFLDPSVVMTRWQHFRVARGDVLLSTSASLGRIATVDDASVGAIPYTGIIRMRPRSDEVFSSFIPYLLESRHFQQQVEAMGVGSVIRHFGPSHLRQMSVVLPSRSEQRAIVDILGALDDKIELNRRMSETLEEMARALFKSWFVDFDPVHAKAAGKRAYGMDEAIAALFPERFEDSELGPIPKGWTCSPMAQWVDVYSGGTPSKANSALWSGKIPWISPKVMNAIHVEDSDQHVSETAIGAGTRLAPAGATLVMVRGMGLHHEVRVSQARRAVTFNQDVKALVGTAIDQTLLLYALLNAQGELLERVESSGHGTGKLPTDVLVSHKVTMPGPKAQGALAQPIVALNERLAVARQDSRALAALRDTLLPKLLSGELSVARAEALVEATV